MNIDLKGSFTGLGTDGSITNVETINLTNNTTIDRTFNAKNITGVEKYTLTGEKAISLSNLAAAGIEVKATGLQDAYSIAFNSDLDLSGTADAMTLSLDGVGAAKAGTTAQNNVAVTMANIEDLTLKTSGNESFVNLGAVDATSYTVSGDANLTVSAVKNGLKTIDASGLSGNFTIDTTGVTTPNSITSIVAGSGDDAITIDTDDLTANASINGGTGADTLVVQDGTGDTVQYAMSGVETVKFENANATTFSATNVNDLTTVQVNTAGAAAVSVVNLGSRDITVQTEGAIAAAQDVSVDNSGTTTVNLNASATSTASKGTGLALANAEEVDGDITAANSAAVVFNVNDYVNFKGDAKFAKATDVTLNVASAKNAATAPTEQTGFSGNLNITKATSLTIDAKGSLTLAATNNDLSAVETLNLTTDGFANMSDASASLDSAATVVLAGTNNNSQVSLARVGTDGATAVDYDLSIEASGLKAGLTQNGAIASQQSVTVDTSAVTGNVSLAVGSGITGQNVTLNNVEAAGTYTVGAVNATSAGSGTADINASGSAKAVSIGNIGAGTAFKTVNVDVSGALDDVTLGTITGTDVTVNAENALKNVFVSDSANQTAADITVKDSLTFTAGLKAADDSAGGLDGVTVATTTDATDTTITLNGNIGDDYFTILGADAEADAKITVKGDLDIGANTLTVNTSAITGDSKSTIDLSDLSAAGTSTISITGSKNADTITGSAGDDTITGGAGDDTFVFSAAATNGSDTIKDFSTGTDVLKVSTTGTLVGSTSGGLDVADASSDNKLDTAAYEIGQISDNAASDWSDVLDVINGAIKIAGDTTAGNAETIIAIDNGTDTRIYNFTDDGNNDTAVQSSELVLVGTLTGVSDATTVDHYA